MNEATLGSLLAYALVLFGIGYGIRRLYRRWKSRAHGK